MRRASWWRGPGSARARHTARLVDSDVDRLAWDGPPPAHRGGHLRAGRPVAWPASVSLGMR
ncbi:hypothetical protein D5R93_07205 [Actinomyces lilanjuaniae]|uniref:Uncharacterized protein n=1 Tax=Actinomyces lilanjuaniae TaxID=2321394 RepID=A0ABM6Z3G7_9ACTO|nr:hypothetical protein D5R93_07205 [Actinomyces lilanjuaniae]